MTRASPRNRLDRAQRQARWDSAAEEGRRNQACPLEGDKSAKYTWLKFVAASDLPALARLVAHTLAFYGKADGSDIFPGIREIKRCSGLSDRTVTAHIDILVRRGWLARHERQPGKAWTMGVRYELCLPHGIRTDQSPKRVQPPKVRGYGAEGRSTPPVEASSTLGADARSTRARTASESRGVETGASGVEAPARGVEAGAAEVSKELRPTSSSEHSIEWSTQCPPSRTGDAPTSAGDGSQSRAEPETQKHAAPRLDPVIERELLDLLVNKKFSPEQIARLSKYRHIPLETIRRFQPRSPAGL